MKNTERLDRWMEAVYGARLRFHTDAVDLNSHTYWARVYSRWQELYRSGK